MASGGSDGLSDSSGEEQDFFAGFTVEGISEMRQDRQRRREQGSLRDVDEEIDILIDQQPQESASNSDVEVFVDDGDEESGESSDEETAEDAPPDPLRWSNTLSGINVEEFSVRHGPSRNLGDNATAKDYFNLFINDEFLDESARKAKAAPSRLRTHVNSVVFLCVAKCGVKGLALLNGTDKRCRNKETEFFLYCICPCYFYYNAVSS